MDFTLTDIKTKIGQRVGDPNLDTYSDRVEEYFWQAMTEILSDDSLFSIEEVPELAEPYDLSFTPVNGIYRHGIADMENVMRIYECIEAYAEDVAYRLQRVTLDDYNAFVDNDYLKPSSNEVWYMVAGNELVFITATGSGFGTPSFVNVRIMAIKNPDVSRVTSSDYVSGLHYSARFIIQCINRAAKLLRQEILMESA